MSCQSHAFFFPQTCIYIYRFLHTLTHTHSPVTFHSAFFPISLQGGSARARDCSTPSFQEPFQSPRHGAQPEQREGSSSSKHLPAFAVLSMTFTPTPHCPFHHSCPSCFSTKGALPIALERDQFLTHLFLALSHALVMLIEVQTCTADLSPAKNQNSPGLVPGCTKVLKWFGLAQHFITLL